MNKFILSFLIAVSFPCTVFSGEPDEKLHTKCLYPTIRISAANAGYRSVNNGLLSGSGFIVRSEKVGDKYHNVAITCEHVIANRDKITVMVPEYENWSWFKGWKKYPAFVWSGSDAYDLAILLFSTEHKVPVVDISFEPIIYIGNDIFHSGCGSADEPRLDYGKLTSMSSKANSMKFPSYRLNCFLIPGDSGGPIFHENQVIGVAQAVKSINHYHSANILGHFSYAIPIKRIKRLKEYEVIQNAELPVIPYLMLEAEKYKIVYNP